ncbi:hypothetical protein SKAU_G00001240 [Synaphobranchus kaupii]|uniref:Uncharacterized protein n=1 Tax=Synaphobranchus kaupii TaxID=118154 RepID=A0A9Q1JAA1_SYNKA|nr:hypothetical protein SKAU_G00001240 [Synaphobranchus kaupii]
MFTIMHYSHSCFILQLILFCSFANGQHESKWNDRPFVVLKNQNIALLVSVLSVLLFVMIAMAVCVYKPLRHR